MRSYILISSTAAALVLAAGAASAAGMTLGWPGAQATFVGYDRAGCVRTQVDVFVRGAGISDRAAAAKLFLAISRYDECRDVELMQAERRLPLRAGMFHQEADLSAATLEGAFTLPSRASGKATGLKIKIAWTATEESVTAPVKAVTEGLGEVIRAKSPTMRSMRLAAASGSIEGPAGNLTPAAATDASLSRTWVGRPAATGG